ncbi:hypothetical protein AAFF_G00049850 [Aldrovandia affinis]|uniref:SERTA domain-containing protein n=1 Tax=Aldrovandia affinis TaxID=143900 RepID=A0AAD7S1D8_9TELE|nr:hypothetical protein AAFF_G00049850 [Aldrovandia affinis]
MPRGAADSCSRCSLVGAPSHGSLPAARHAPSFPLRLSDWFQALPLSPGNGPSSALCKGRHRAGPGPRALLSPPEHRSAARTTGMGPAGAGGFISVCSSPWHSNGSATQACPVCVSVSGALVEAGAFPARPESPPALPALTTRSLFVSSSGVTKARRLTVFVMVTGSGATGPWPLALPVGARAARRSGEGAGGSSVPDCQRGLASRTLQHCHHCCRCEPGALYMLGKGEKRKLDEDEDGLEGKALAPPASMADGPSKVSYTLQRQTIFNISLMKLYSQRALTEPRLERRVLINNMLRRIQEELRQEGGGPRAMFFPASGPPDDPADEGFREAPPAFGVAPPLSPPRSPGPLGPLGPALAPPDSCLTPASLLEDDASLFCTSPSPHPHPQPRPPAKDSFSSALEDIEELRRRRRQDLRPEGGGGGLTGGPGRHGGDGRAQVDDGHRAARRSGHQRLLHHLSSSSSGFLTDLALDDILFADIDTSMYDFDACTSASGAAPSKTAPPVVTADDLVKTLSPYGGGAASSVAPSQPFKMDLAELDHIMEVLVGS